MSGPVPRNTLPAAEKLKSRKALEALYEQGRALSAFPLRMLVLRVPYDERYPVKIAVTAPKRRLKLATDRNRMKRLIREAWRLNKQDLMAHCRQHTITYHLLFISQCNTPATYARVEEKLILLLKRLTADDQENNQ